MKHLARFNWLSSLVAVVVFCLSVGVTKAVEAEQDLDWKAQWIWQAEAGPANAWVAFRKTVNIDQVPSQVVANLSADSKFWLWINGELAVFEGGQSRGPSPAKPWDRVKEMWELPPERKPSNTWYETFDITEYLQPGENTIAVLVWYWGRETHKGTHIDSGQGGLIFQADLGDELLMSDKSWRVKQNPAYALDSGTPDKAIVQYNVRFDARQQMQGWTQPGFADRDWQAAAEKGVPPVAPWYRLVKHNVPRLVDHGLQNYDNYSADRFPFVSSGETIVCRLPFNKQVTPYLEIEAEGGEVIQIKTDNRLNRITAEYTARSGRQSFESFSWMNGHTIQYDIPAGVKVLGLKYRWMSVGEMAGTFACDDPFFDRIWWMGRNTLYVCARDNFMDCPDRERALWIGDVADQASYLFYCMDDSGRQLLKKAIMTTMAYSHDGVFAGLGPLRLRHLPSQSLQFVDQGVWQYYFNTGDRETLAYAYPYIRTYLDLWVLNKDGLPVRRQRRNMDMWNWFDWGKDGTLDAKMLEPAMYFHALKGARKMAVTLGRDEDVAWYDERIESTKEAFNQAFWTGSYYSSNPTKFQDDRGNAMAILAGLADPDKHDTIAENVLIPNHFCSPHFEWMVQEALCYAGRYQDALDRMKARYQSQVDRTSITTLYEKFPNGGSYNHAWNAPNTILSKHIAGIRPTQPGWAAYEIMPHMLHLKSIETRVPSVRGDIDIKLKQDEKSFHLQLQSPEQTTATVGVPTSTGEVQEVRINQQIVWENGASVEGLDGVRFISDQGDHLSFQLQPGAWDLAASYR